MIVPVVAGMIMWVMTQPGFARGTPDGFADLAEKLLPAVVNIQTTQTIDRPNGAMPPFELPPGSPFQDFFDQFGKQGQDSAPRKATSLGSGFIIDPSGIIVTNNHVIDGADDILVVLQDNTKLEAKLIGTDPKTDVAVLQVKTDKKLPSVSFGDSSKARVGDWVVAIGNPLGLGGTVTAGIVSARGRDINSGPYDDYIQTDAPINRGNSGGPLFNMDGDVIGINTAIYSPNGGSIGIGFSVPSNQAKHVVEQIRKYGSTRRGWLGVTIQQVTDEIAESMGLKDAAGALVSTVHPNSPASKAGVKSGDVIVSFNDREVPSSRALPRMVANTNVGSTVPMTVWRDGKEIKLDVTLGQLEKVDLASLGDKKTKRSSAGDENSIGELGMTIAPMSEQMQSRFDIKAGKEGVVVTAVENNSDAAEKAIRPGTVIVKVNQEPVSTPDDVVSRIKEAKDQGRKSVLLLLDQGGELRFVALKITG